MTTEQHEARIQVLEHRANTIEQSLSMIHQDLREIKDTMVRAVTAYEAGKASAAEAHSKVLELEKRITATDLKLMWFSGVLAAIAVFKDAIVHKLFA